MLSKYDLIIFDTSFLLSLYEYSSETVEEVLIILEKNKSKIWLPHQVYKEFEKNLKDKDFIKIAIGNYNLPNKNLNIIIDKFNKELTGQLREYRTKRYPKIKELTKNLKNKLDETKTIITEYKASIKDENQKNKLFHKEDKIYSFVKELKNLSQVGENYSSIELLDIYREGEERYTYQIPPGYKDDERYSKDKGKKTPQKFGDLLVWKQILKQVKNKSQKVLFITNDKKEDWIEDNQLREELLLEFIQSTDSSTIKKLNLDEFMYDSNISNREIKVKKLINESLIENHFLNLKIIEILEENLETKINSYPHKATRDFPYELIFESIVVNELLDLEVVDGLEIEEIEEDKFIQATFNLNLEVTIEINDYLKANLDVYIYIEALIDIEKDFKIEELETIEFEIKSIYSEDKDICAICHINEGIYEDENGDMICDSCSIDLICCSGCGLFFKETSQKLWGHKCSDCVMSEDD